MVVGCRFLFIKYIRNLQEFIDVMHSALLCKHGSIRNNMNVPCMGSSSNNKHLENIRSCLFQDGKCAASTVFIMKKRLILFLHGIYCIWMRCRFSQIVHGSHFLYCLTSGWLLGSSIFTIGTLEGVTPGSVLTEGLWFL